MSRMTRTDLPEVLRIERLSYTAPWTPGIFEQELRNRQFARYLVLRLGNVLCGYGGLWIVWREGHITNLTVHPSFRQQGLGSLILIVLMEMARKAKLKLLTLEVRSSNEGARKLYARHGFRETGLRRGYYLDNGEDAVIMHCDQLLDDTLHNLLKERRNALLERHAWELELCVAL